MGVFGIFLGAGLTTQHRVCIQHVFVYVYLLILIEACTGGPALQESVFCFVFLTKCMSFIIFLN